VLFNQQYPLRFSRGNNLC